jgi:Protein of unknown function (DUF2589)
MSNGVKDLRALPLFEIIGAPLVAMVQAEILAARATVDYIEKVGFVPGADPSQPGSLRVAEFRYTKLDENRQPAEFTARVPVLSLVPIPGVQIKTARVAFAARITDAYTEGAANSQTSGGTRSTWLQPALTQYRGGLAPVARDSTGTSAVKGTYELSIEVELEQMPLAPGLEKILNMMDQAIADAKSQ